MPSINRKWSEERLGFEDYPMNFVGFSPFIRWGGPLVAKPGDAATSRRGVKWIFGKALASLPTPTSVAAVISLTTVNGVITAVGAIGTAGTCYRKGEIVPVTGGFGGRLKVTAVNASGGITAAAIAKHLIAPGVYGPEAGGAGYPATGNMTLAAAAAPYSLVDAADLYEGDVQPGTAYRSFAPANIGEFGWFESVA